MCHVLSILLIALAKTGIVPKKIVVSTKMNTAENDGAALVCSAGVGDSTLELVTCK